MVPGPAASALPEKLLVKQTQRSTLTTEFISSGNKKPCCVAFKGFWFLWNIFPHHGQWQATRDTELVRDTHNDLFRPCTRPLTHHGPRWICGMHRNHLVDSSKHSWAVSSRVCDLIDHHWHGRTRSSPCALSSPAPPILHIFIQIGPVHSHLEASALVSSAWQALSAEFYMFLFAIKQSTQRSALPWGMFFP